MTVPEFVAAAIAHDLHNTAISVDIPPDASPGDRAILVMAHTVAAVVAQPAGWEPFEGSPFGPAIGGSAWLRIWETVIGSSPEVEPGATVTVEMSSATRLVLAVYIVAPSNVANFRVSVPSGSQAGPPFLLTTPQVFNVPDNSRLLHIYGVRTHTNDDLPNIWTPDAATTERVQASTTHGSFDNATMLLADEVFSAAPGDTPSRTAQSTERMRRIAATIVLSIPRPEASAGTATPAVAMGANGVQLTGSGFGGAGDPYTFVWRQISGPAVALSSTTEQNPTFDAPDEATDLVFGLTVTDADGIESHEDTVAVQVFGPSNNIYLDISPDNKLQAFIAGVSAWKSDDSVPPGRWTHIAVTRSDAGVALYIDGQDAGIAQEGGSIGINFGAGTHYIGSWDDGKNPLSGQTDDVRLFDTAFNQTEVQQWMNTPVGGVSSRWRQRGGAMFKAHLKTPGGLVELE